MAEDPSGRASGRSNRPRGPRRYDAVVVGGGHNGLVAAALLGRAGRSVVLLERRGGVGGAAVSSSPFDGVDVRLSRYAYLVSLFPAALLRMLDVRVEMRPRAVASYTTAAPGSTPATVAHAPSGEPGLLVETGVSPSEEWARFYGMVGQVARRVFPTLTQPLLSREQMRSRVADERAWNALFEEPLSRVVEETFGSDLVRGVVMTDALIGTFAALDDPLLRQNRCFLYHVIGNGTGRWDVPVGGIGALSEALATAATRAGVEIRTGADVVSVATDGTVAEVGCADGTIVRAGHVLANVAPAVLSRLLEEGGSAGVAGPGGLGTSVRALASGLEAGTTAPAPEGSQLKINTVLRRLPRLRDPSVAPERAFAGTFHVNEGYEQLQSAYQQAAAGRIPAVPPCELYCHTLTDPSILSGELREAGAHTLTLFGLHMPARLFTDPEMRTGAKREAVAATLRSVNSVLAEPLEECLWPGPDGNPCIEALTPPELESELGMPSGHIFHRDLAWPFAESEEEVGTWGAETQHANVWLCGAGARRGGGVSGIPGHNAARAVLAARSGG